MKTHEFADLLLSMPDREFDISVDVSTNDVNVGERAFTSEYIGVNDIEEDELTLLFSGNLNTI